MHGHMNLKKEYSIFDQSSVQMTVTRTAGRGCTTTEEGQAVKALGTTQPLIESAKLH